MVSTFGLLEIKRCETFFLHDDPKNTLPRDPNFNVDVVMWPKFGKVSISMRDVIIKLSLLEFDQKNFF